MTPHSSDICKRYKHCGIAKAHHIFRTKNKNIGGVGLRQEKAFLLSAGGEELSAFVEGRTCLHYFHLLHQAEPTHLGERSEGSGSGHGCPLDVEVDILALQLPHIPCEGGFHPLGAVLKVGLVVATPGFPLRLGEADVRLLLLAVRLHLSLIDGVCVEAPGAVHWAVFGSSSAVAVSVEGPLDWQVVLQDLGVVGSDDATQVGHRAVRQLDCVMV